MNEDLIRAEVAAALIRLRAKHPALAEELDQSYGYAVFPMIGRASLVLGGAYGRGEVFEQGRSIGFASLSQMTVGVQVGGQTFSEVLLFADKAALDTFRAGKVAFTANATAAITKAAASGTANYDGVAAHVYSRGGMLLEASLGGQKFNFIPPERPRGADGEEPGAKAREGDKSPRGLLRRAQTRVAARIRGHGISTRLFPGAKKELELGRRLHADVVATLERMKEKDESLTKQIDQAYAYAVFPSVGKASLVLGASYGKGEVIRSSRVFGYARVLQFTLGVQVGGQTFSELVLLRDKEALQRLERGDLGFAADASAVVVKAGAAATNDYKDGMQIYVHSEGGLALEGAIGVQKIAFRRAVLRRGRRVGEMPAVRTG